MEIKGRKIALSRIVPKAYQFADGAFRAIRIFENPGEFLSCYINKRSPKGGVVKLRNGMTIHVSSHPDDIVTLFVVFCKQDYGTDFQGKKIIDIGSNIGTFALYAAMHGAERIVSAEPSQEAFACVQKNVEANNLQDKIIPLNLAVSGKGGEVVQFAVEASPYNQLGNEQVGETYDVHTTTLHDVMAEHFPDGVDMMKMDCEGAEFDIMDATGMEDLTRIDDVKMEYHRADYPNIIKKFEEAGLKMAFHQPGRGNDTGTIWMKRA